ncbi:MAG: lipocalin-like domain-containing protein [Verrucomicrobiota bacterium JB022]|nr:lipocalin-like domain-containing protein [Verrucomicrobiota bacterium JB022]
MKKTLLTLSLLAAAVLRAEIPATTDDGFAVPQPGHTFSFPRDHGSHPEFKIEWWYLTGHLRAGDDWRFGYQATFFRFAGPKDDAAGESDPLFGTDQLFLAQFALADLETGTFYQQSRLDREGWNASAATERLNVRQGPWRLEWPEGAEAFELVASAPPDVQFSLQLEPVKPLIVFGQDGTSRKGADPAARSYYLTFTRLQTTGTVSVGGEELAVTGQSWMDHEIASKQLGNELEGWDWTAIQLDDGREVKAYILREEGGSKGPFSALMWIDPAGKVTYYGADDFQWEAVRWWESPETGNRYPIEVKITAPTPSGVEQVLHLRPALDGQEVVDIRGDNTYWEGACEVVDESDKVIGRAYLELVGYGTSTAERLQ